MINHGVTPDVTLQRLTNRDRTRLTSMREWIATITLAAVVLAAQANAFTLSGGLVADDAGVTPKLSHAALIIASALLLRGRIARPRAELLLYFVVMITTTLMAYALLESRVAVLKLFIALYVAVIAGAMGRVAGPRVVLRACRAASVAFLLIITMKNAQHIPAFVAHLASPSGHPDVPSLSAGGLNIEATWLGLSSIFLIGTALFVPYVLMAAATSMVYATRAGIVVAVVAVIAALAHAWGTRRAARIAAATLGTTPRPGTRWVRAQRAFALGIAATALVGALAAVSYVQQYGDAAYVARRFSTIGEEPGSMGRLTLWRGGLTVFADYPFGVGVGNAIPVLRRVFGVDVPEDNLHNIYLQHAVETGIPGLIVLLLFAATVARRALATRCTDHLLLFVAAYFVVGVIQFTGVDGMLWLVYGLQSGVSSGGDHA